MKQKTEEPRRPSGQTSKLSPQSAPKTARAKFARCIEERVRATNAIHTVVISIMANVVKLCFLAFCFIFAAGWYLVILSELLDLQGAI